MSDPKNYCEEEDCGKEIDQPFNVCTDHCDFHEFDPDNHFICVFCGKDGTGEMIDAAQYALEDR